MFEEWELREFREIVAKRRLVKMGFDANLLNAMKIDVETDGHPDYMVHQNTTEPLVWLGAVKCRMGVEEE